MMRASWLAVVVAVALVACHSDQASTLPPPRVVSPGCVAVAAHVVTMVHALDMPSDLMAKIVGAVVAGEVAAHCDDDHWTAELVRCMTAYKTVDEGDRCAALLTPAQRDALAAPPPP